MERFEAKYEKNPNGCWLWTACRNTPGYGSFKFEGHMWRAHRFSYELNVGSIPEGIHVLHKCDVPACVNPDHLFLGTHNDNMADKVKKNRQAKGMKNEGEKNGSAKLTPNKVLAIKSDTRFHRVIAADYGVSSVAISNIKSGKSWAHLE